MTKLKAMGVLECRAWVLEKYGPEGSAQVKARMSEPARSVVFAEDLLAVDWLEVPIALEHALAVDAAFGNGDGTVANVMITDLTSRHIKGIYRTLFTRPGPRETLTSSSRLWRRYYDTGETMVDFPNDHCAVKRLVGCPDLPLKHDWLLTPYYAEMVRQAGASDVKVEHKRCVAHGAEFCVTEINWK